MKPPNRIHHINFLVRDLDAAIRLYEDSMGLAPFVEIDHAVRGSRIARSKIGETWFVLICPYDDTSVPGRHLKEHGEGFFLLSLGVDDLDEHLRQLEEAERGDIRQGILDWTVADAGMHFGASLQFTDERSD
ncbi:MAG: VOC family protein [Woeseiaceae bacterium]|nr:VOC family protein [Woeseiaceae bacterium]